MRHKIKVLVPVERRTLFGKKTVLEKRTRIVDHETYKRLKEQEKRRPYSIEEMMVYDDIIED